MSNPIQAIPTPTGEFQAHFGGSPGSADLAADCKQWEKLCGELLAERAKLNTELNELRQMYDACSKTLFHLQCKEWKFEFDQSAHDDALAHIDDKPTVAEIIAELQNAEQRA